MTCALLFGKGHEAVIGENGFYERPLTRGPSIRFERLRQVIVKSFMKNGLLRIWNNKENPLPHGERGITFDNTYARRRVPK